MLRLLTESLPVGVLHVHANGEPGMPNPAWACLTNTDRNDGVEEFLNRLTDGDAVRRLLDSARDDGMVNDLSVTFDGDRPACRHADLAIRPLSADAPPFSLLLTLTDTSESVATHTALHRQSRHDHLTGALNRRGLEERVTEVLKDRRTSRVTVLYCDLNDFKGINDSHGHYTGDAVLEAVATEISGELRPDDLVGRWGGDEFLIVLVDLDPDDVTLVVNRIERRLSGRTDLLDGHELTMSVGRADAEPGDDFDSLLRRADAAMYDVKSQWRARRVG